MKNMKYHVDVIVSFVILIMEIFGNILYFKIHGYIQIHNFKYIENKKYNSFKNKKRFYKNKKDKIKNINSNLLYFVFYKNI